MAKKKSCRKRLSEALRLAHERLGTWENVSQKIFKGRVDDTTLWAIANKDYWPKDKEILRYLQPKSYKSIQEMPVSELSRRVRERRSAS